MTEDQYRNAIRSAAVVVLPLDDEETTSGQLVLLHAMHCGRPVVATRAQGTSDYVDHDQTGLMVPAQSPEVLARAVNGILNDPDKAHGLDCEAARAARSRFSSAIFWRTVRFSVLATPKSPVLPGAEDPADEGDAGFDR